MLLWEVKETHQSRGPRRMDEQGVDPPGDVFAGSGLGEKGAEAVVALGGRALDAAVGAQTYEIASALRVDGGGTVKTAAHRVRSCRAPLRTKQHQHGFWAAGQEAGHAQQALPSWQPAWPTWIEMTSLMLTGGYLQQSGHQHGCS